MHFETLNLINSTSRWIKCNMQTLVFEVKNLKAKMEFIRRLNFKYYNM